MKELQIYVRAISMQKVLTVLKVYYLKTFFNIYKHIVSVKLIQTQFSTLIIYLQSNVHNKLVFKIKK